MDKSQVIAFLDFLVGYRSIGVDSNGDEVEVPICPEARAFVVGRLGVMTPANGWRCVTDGTPAGRSKALTVARMLREVVDYLEAPEHLP